MKINIGFFFPTTLMHGRTTISLIAGTRSEMIYECTYMLHHYIGSSSFDIYLGSTFDFGQ
jgi:hypothetical protein